MKVKNIIDEDFINYKKPSMFILTTKCSMKCNINGNIVCQNYDMLKLPDIEIEKETLCERYLNNPITSAIVFGGLEPFDTELDVIPFIDCLRNRYNCDDDIVIYTGYTESELESGYRVSNNYSSVAKNLYNDLKKYKNIIIKFGRYIPSEESHIDDVLGVRLSSNNQYAKVISLKNN